MRTALALSAVVLATASCVAAPAGDAGLTATPVVRLVSTEPVTVRGEGFAARERVLLRAVTRRGSKWQRVTATARGVFSARFALRGDVCAVGLVRVVATGSSGSRAVLRMPIGACQPLGAAG